MKTNTWKYRHVAHAYKVCSKGNSRLDRSFDLCKFVQENSKKGLMSNSYLNSLWTETQKKTEKKNNGRGQRSPEHLFRKWYNQVTNLVHSIIYQCARQWRQSCHFSHHWGQKKASDFRTASSVGGRNIRKHGVFFILSQSLVFLQFPLDLVHALPSRHLGVQSSEANFLSSRLLHHFPRLNLFSPTIFHSLLLTNASSI